MEREQLHNTLYEALSLSEAFCEEGKICVQTDYIKGECFNQRSGHLPFTNFVLFKDLALNGFLIKNVFRNTYYSVRILDMNPLSEPSRSS